MNTERKYTIAQAEVLRTLDSAIREYKSSFATRITKEVRKELQGLKEIYIRGFFAEEESKVKEFITSWDTQTR